MAKDTWILKISAKKGCFLSFEWEKLNFTTFFPLQNFSKNSLVHPLETILPTPMWAMWFLQNEVENEKYCLHIEPTLVAKQISYIRQQVLLPQFLS